jgi:hypothetical protein
MNTADLTDKQRQALEHVERARPRNEAQRLCEGTWSVGACDL